MNSWRTWAAILFDGIVYSFSLLIAFCLRFEGNIPKAYLDLYIQTLPLVLIVRYSVSVSLGLYKGIFRYASMNDLLKIFQAASLGSGLLAIGFYFFFLHVGFPRSVFILDWIFVIFFSGLGRFSYRLVQNWGIRDLFKKDITSTKHRVLVVGAGDAGETIVRECLNRRSKNMNVIGFVDDDRQKQGKEIHGCKVLGKIEEIPKLVIKHSISQVLIAIPSLTGKRVQRIVHLCRDAEVKCLTLPSVEDIVGGNVRIDMIREVDLNDLIRRRVRRVLQPETLNYIQNKRILVTGAAGSIGSEIVRQLLNQNLESLILIDQGETPMFHLKYEIKQLTQNSKRVSYHVADIRDRERMESIFLKHQPQVVYHAAAYKHVPLMEENPEEAFRTNCFGTQNIAQLCHQNSVESFVMLSTDKAADPVNFMGASKRLAEKYIQAYGEESLTRFISVRFGNVLGTKGSVVPLFQEMIRRGGPVSVTDSEIKRFFMTVEEAADLVLHAGGVGKNGHILVLEMGTPLKIKDLAEELIRLSGLIPYEDIEIKYTGLRKGERKTEILIGQNEKLVEIGYEFIQTLLAPKASLDEMDIMLNQLNQILKKHNSSLLKDFLVKKLPEYQLNPSVEESKNALLRK